MARYALETVRPGYVELWDRMQVRPECVAAADKEAKQVIANRKRYEAVAAKSRVPWFVIGCLHMREAAGRFDRWLHNGDRMRDDAGRPIRTVRVPPNRPPDPNVSWEVGAYDALVTVQHLDRIKNWGPEHVAYAAEDFNGWGYRNPAINIPSPYLWGGTNVQKRGKYIADHKFDRGTMDTQLGTMAVLKRIMDLCPDARFVVEAKPVEAPVVPVPTPAPAPEPQLSPKATEDVNAETRPPVRSRTIWGAVLSGVSGFFATVMSLFAYLNNPYALAGFTLVVILIGIGVFMTIRGYIDVRAVVAHLTDDDSDGAS